VDVLPTMNRYISFYDPTGKITGMTWGSDYVMDMHDKLQGTREGQKPYVSGEWQDKPVYVLNGEVTDRPVNPMVVSNHYLSGMVHPCTIAINGTEYHCDSSTADLELFHPGVYKVKVTAWPYLDREFTIENPA